MKSIGSFAQSVCNKQLNGLNVGSCSMKPHNPSSFKQPKCLQRQARSLLADMMPLAAVFTQHELEDPSPPFPSVWISLYYLAFYVVMTGIFALSIYSLMRTVNPYEPDYQDQLKSPGTVTTLTIPFNLSLKAINKC